MIKMNVKQLKHLRITPSNHNYYTIIIIVASCIIAIFLGRLVGGYLLGDKVNAAFLSDADITTLSLLILRRVLILLTIGLTSLIIGLAIFKQDVSALVVGSLLSLQINRYIGFGIVLYVDHYGSQTELNLTSFLIILTFVIFFFKNQEWVRLTRGSTIFWCFIIIAICGFATQIYHLGLKDGIAVVYYRVIQPLIFIVPFSYIATNKKGLQKIFLSLVITLILGIIFRIMSPHQEISRVAFLGSWTIYGTILAATLPFAITLLITISDIKLRLFLFGTVPLLVWELFLTQTRGAIASLGTLGLLVLEKRLRWPILILVVLIFLAYIIGIIPIPNNLEFSGRRFLSLDPQIMLKDRNWVTRVDRNKIAIAYILSHPFSGIALGQPPADPKYNEIASWVYNTYLHWGVAMGIPAMLAFTVLMLYLIKNAIRNFIISEKEMKVYQLSILIALLIWLINQFTTADSLTYLSDANSTLFFYAVVGMVLGQSLTYKTAFPVITGRREASARTNNKRQ